MSKKTVTKNVAETKEKLPLEPHELLNLVPEMCVPYSVYQNPKGNVTYINEDLCLELGLTNDLKKLKDDILDKFNLRILNEYDRLFHTNPGAKNVKPYSCFATRYLQLQHKNNQGKTSGDGRAIWNGTVTHNNTIWDISSRGTGVTALAPGVVNAKEPLATGNTDYGYSCGLSDLKEIYSSVIMSERFYKLGFSTERVLAVIDTGNNLGICIRASQNLIRPAHLFRYLKLNDHYGAKTLLDYVIDRDHRNKKINFSSKDKDCYDKYLSYFSNNFCHLAAQAKHKEAFIWLDWDGDNILIDGGIIDYGSVRHFGAHHNKYIYDDIDRFSTNLDQQVIKARLIVQTFCQLTEFIKTKNKTPLKRFKEYHLVKNFLNSYEEKLPEFFVSDFSLSQTEQNQILRWHKKDIKALYDKVTKLKSHKATNLMFCLDGKNAWPSLNLNRLLFDLDSIKSELDVLPFKADFIDKIDSIRKLPVQQVLDLKKSFLALEHKLDTKLKYIGDVKSRLTSTAILHLVDLAYAKKDPQSFLNKCINFGFSNDSPTLAQIREMYQDEL